METDEVFEQAVQRHDAQAAALGLPLWVGSEPTFTDRLAQTPAWLHAALGDDKEPRARADPARADTATDIRSGRVQVPEACDAPEFATHAA